MSHPRHVFRHAVAARLAGLRDDGSPWTAAGPRVLLARKYDPASAAELPAVLVHGRGEWVFEGSYPSEGENGALRRVLKLAIDCIAEDGGNAEDETDALAEGVEAALEWLEIPGHESATLRLMRSRKPRLWTGTSLTMLVRRLVVHVRYHTLYRTAPEDAPYSPRLLVSPLPYVGAGNQDAYEELLP